MRHHTRGFTLIELLVAISLMALMAVLSWRGLDGTSRSQSQLQQRSDDVQALQSTLGQWGADLDALAEQPNTPSLDWDGRAMRILRRSSTGTGAGLVVVAWARRTMDGAGQWLRWQSPELHTRGELDLAWQKAQLWAQTPSEDDRQREVRTVALDAWQIFFYRGNAWTNPLSSAGTPAAVNSTDGAATTTGADNTTPDGVRLVLNLSGGQALSGTLTRDWVRPVLVGSP
nr:prepilin-type N-terminal cleavage/methylation domain-containing protein [uncultured Rhodoferax sp.]